MKLRFVITFCLLTFSSVSHATLWNRVVATYDETVVTLWEVEREMMVTHILKQPKPVGADQVFTVSEDQLREFIKDYLVEKIVLDEASGFQVDSLTKAEKTDLLIAFQKKFKRKSHYLSFLNQNQWTESDLTDSLARSSIVENFVKQKILSSYIYISDDEIKEARRTHPAFSTEDAKQFLKKSKLKDNLRDWINALKRKHQVQLIDH